MITFMKSWHPTKPQKSNPILPCLQQRSQAIHICHTGAHEASGLPQPLRNRIWNIWRTSFGLLGGASTQGFVCVYLCLYRFLVFLCFVWWISLLGEFPITWFVTFFNGLADFTCISFRFLPSRISFFEGMCCFYLLSMPKPWRNKDSWKHNNKAPEQSTSYVDLSIISGTNWMQYNSASSIICVYLS